MFFDWFILPCIVCQTFIFYRLRKTPLNKDFKNHFVQVFFKESLETTVEILVQVSVSLDSLPHTLAGVWNPCQHNRIRNKPPLVSCQFENELI